MSGSKQSVREAFRAAVFKRDGYRCRKCLKKARMDKDGRFHMIEGQAGLLDAHHITDRNLMPAGGYVVENGISLCPSCHELAERFHSTGTSAPDYAPSDLYRLIQSSELKARAADEATKAIYHPRTGVRLT